MTNVSPTPEEIRAAIDGKLHERKEKGKPNQVSLTAINKNGDPIGHPIGITTGLPIFLAWCYIFQRNEKSENKMTDEQISNWIKTEFPGRQTKCWNRDGIAGVRKNYNRGQFTEGSRPKVQSQACR